MSNRTMKLISKSAIHLSHQKLPCTELNETRRRAMRNQLNRVLAATVDTARWVEHAYWQATGWDGARLKSLLVFAHVQLRLQSRMVSERTFSLDGHLPVSARQGCVRPYPVGPLSVGEHAREIADRLGQLADEIRFAIDECAQLNDHAPTEVLTGSLDVARELRHRIENMAASLADIGAHGGLEPDQDRETVA
jgi:hypothetical protein